MKTDRLIGILSILLQQKKVTAPVLAEKFEVSRRTINRDIEDLCKAGIPVVTTQGPGGGISIMENYKMDRTLLTSAEMQAILAGLRSLDSVSGTNQYRLLMDKLSGGGEDFISGSPSVLIDLSAWSKSAFAGKIALIQRAIEEGTLISFAYFSPKGEGERCIEPYYLVFKWSSWYVYGWCTARRDYRLFKLNRMDGLADTGKAFSKRNAPLPDLSTERVFPGGYQVKALFEPECKWRLIEEFGKESYREQPDGRLLFSFEFTEKDNLFSWILTFGDKAELLEPAGLREEFFRIGEAMREKYAPEPFGESSTGNRKAL